MLTHSFN